MRVKTSRIHSNIVRRAVGAWGLGGGVAMVDDLDEKLRKLNTDFDARWARFVAEEWPELVAKTDSMVAALLAEPIGFFDGPR